MNAVAPSGDLNVAKNSDADIFGGEAGVVKALSTLRQAAIPPKDKDSLRNLFLTYAGESDEVVRATIKSQIIEQIGKNPQLSSLIVNEDAKETKTEPKPQSNFNDSLGQTRPTPSFIVSEASPTKVVAPSEPAPVSPAPEKTPEPAAQPETPAPIVAEPTAPIAVGATDVRARIDAIKHDINGRVGNPVNVINADEAIGREYMSALLDAMKRSSAGGGAESLPRLETAYKATLDLIIAKGLGQPTSVPTEVKVVETKAPEVTVAPPAEEPTPVPVPTPAPIKEIETPPQQSEGLYHLPSDEVEAEANPLEAKPASFASKFFNSPTPKKQVVIKETPEPNVRKVEVNPKAETKVATPPEQSDKLQPLQNASATLPEKMAAIKSAAAKREEEAKKPITDLKSPEVEAGLRQLLSEWVLFKKSGFLGTGPSGIDHPLYKQLSGIPMAAVVSGRFEGVTPDIKRHLSDYMTGWRYEQGVMHEMGETFENYLRRVIRQVLERQRALSNKES